MTKLLWTLILGFILTPAHSARAYIPPSHFIVKNLAGKHAGFKAVRVRSEVAALDNDKPTAVRFSELTLYNPRENILRSSALDESGRILYTVERKAGAFPLGAMILFNSRPPELTQALVQSGIPVKSESELASLKDDDARRAAESESLTRWNGALVWVVGKKNDPSQLWVEKDTFLPLRVMARGGLDLHLERYRFYREFPFPRMVTLASDGKKLLQDEVTEVAINTDSPEWKTPVAVTGFTDAGNSAPSALRDLIQKYYETIR